MIPLNALVVYKGKPAIVKEIAGDKYNITLIFGTTAKVREKDIELLHPGPVKNFDGFPEPEKTPTTAKEKIQEAWELLQGEDNSKLTVKELAEIIFSEYTPASSYAAYCVLQDGLYFSGTVDNVKLRSIEEIEAEEAKRSEKMREGEERTNFLERCKKAQITKDDLRFMQDVEALALGKTTKSRTLKELKLGETPEDAHEFLLKTGIWSNMINPHPSRFGLSLNSASISPEPPPNESRQDLTHLEAYAIDAPWSNDPDDAVSIEKDGDNYILFVHVADPASSIIPDSPAEKEARDRGATLYLPEVTVRMIADECLPMFALGLSETSPALTFKITIHKNGEIIDTEIFPSIVKVKRLSYEEADKQLESNETMRALNQLSDLIFKRRQKNGAVDIDLPDVHITIDNGTVNIAPIEQYKSSFIVRECMIAAGEGAGTWASEKGLPMPYLSQEAELPKKIEPGFAGSMQLRKGMRPRVISTKPGRHQGMGLDIYIQVTSPLRRYTDLLAHMQIRAFLRSEAGAQITPLSSDEVSARFGYSEAGTVACVQAERASDLHWKMVYLTEKKDSVWDAVAIEKKGNRWLVLIPALALETQVALNKDAAPNSNVKLILKSVSIPRGEAVFLHS